MAFKAKVQHNHATCGACEKISAKPPRHISLTRTTSQFASRVVPQFLVEMDAILKREYPDIKVVWFGHIGDGNLHINILKPADLSSEEFVKRCKKVDEILFEMIHKFEGSISAEHGVGLTKKPFLHFTRSPEENRADVKSIKRRVRSGRDYESG